MPRVLVAITALTAFVLVVVVACLCSAPSGAGVARVVSSTTSSCNDDVRLPGEGMRFDSCADLDASRIDDLRGTWDPATCVRTDGSGFGDVVPCEPSGDDVEAGA